MKKAILTTEIDLCLQPSFILWGWWCLFSILVLICLWWKLTMVWAVMGTFMYAVASGWQWMQLPAMRWQHSVQTLRVDVYGHMTVMNRAGQGFQASVLPDSVVHPWCMALHLQLTPMQEEAGTESASRHQRLLLLPDQADRKALSALRVWLRWGKA